MPLAIEMAASHARYVGLAQLAAALRDDLSLLAIDGVDVPARQRTMEACIDWSFRQLDPGQQQALLWLSVFEGGFHVADARAVMDGDQSISAIISMLGGLVDRSLLHCDSDHVDSEFRMLHTVRTFARQHASDQSSPAHRRHMEHFAALCEKGGVGLETSEQSHWLTTLSAYASDVDSAMRFAAASGESHLLWQMCGSLTFVWVASGRFAEARQWFASCCEHLDVPVSAQLPARWGAAHLAAYSGDIERALQLADETRALALQIGATTYVARCNNTIGVGGMFTQRTRARAALQSSIESSATGDAWCHVDSSQVLAYIDLQEFRVDDALRRLESVRPLVEQLRHPPLLAWDQLGRYQAAAIRGDVAEAHSIETQVVQAVAAAGDVSISALMVAAQSHVAQRAGRARDTVDEVERSLAKCVAQGAESAALVLLGSLIDACLSVGDVDRAENLLAGTEADIERTAPDATLGLHIQRCRLSLAVGDLAAAESAATARSEWPSATARPRACRRSLLEGARGHASWPARPSRGDRHLPRGRCSEPSGWTDTPSDVCGSWHSAALRSTTALGAARLLGAADSLAHQIGLVDEPCQSLFVDAINELVSTLDEELIAARTHGQTLDADAAFASVARSAGPRRRPSSGWDGLTPAERQVVTLVAEGLTNRQTAERLFIGAGTVKTHLEHAYAKLGVRNRTELTVAFHRHHHA